MGTYTDESDDSLLFAIRVAVMVDFVAGVLMVLVLGACAVVSLHVGAWLDVPLLRHIETRAPWVTLLLPIGSIRRDHFRKALPARFDAVTNGIMRGASVVLAAAFLALVLYVLVIMVTGQGG